MLKIGGSDAADVVDLYLSPDAWIRKINESFAFDGDDVMTRSISYEIEIPSDGNPILHGYRLMPVGTVSRTPAKKVTVYSSHAIGTFPPVITRAEERNIFAAGFAHIMATNPSKDTTKEDEEDLRKQILKIIDVLPLSGEPDRPDDPKEFERRKWEEFVNKYPEFAVRADQLRSNRAVIVPARVSNEADCLQRVVVTYANAFVLRRLTRKDFKRLVEERSEPACSTKEPNGEPVLTSRTAADTAGGIEEPNGDLSSGATTDTQGTSTSGASGEQSSTGNDAGTSAMGGRHFDNERVQSLTKEWNSYGNNRRLVIANSSGSSPRCASGNNAVGIYRDKHPYHVMRDDTYALPIPINSLLDAGSYHAEIICPNGVYFEDAKLRVLNVTGPEPAEEEEGQKERLAEMIIVDDDECHLDRSHVYFSTALSKVGAKRKDYIAGRLNVVLRPTFHSGLRSGMWISIMAVATLIILILTAGLSGLGVNIFTKKGPSVEASLAADPVVAVLLLALTVALGVIIRQREHFLTKAVYARYRTRLFMITASLFVSALVYALGVKSWILMGVLIASVNVSTVCCVITVRSALYSKRRTSGPRAPLG